METNGGLEGYAVCTVSEWPGKAESEPMDLPHCWDVAAMSFPEDHDNEVCGKLISAIPHRAAEQ